MEKFPQVCLMYENMEEEEGGGPSTKNQHGTPSVKTSRAWK